MPAWYNLKQLSLLIGIPRSRLANLVDEGIIPAITYGEGLRKRYRIPDPGPALLAACKSPYTDLDRQLLLTRKEVAMILGCHACNVRYHTASGALKPVKVPVGKRDEKRYSLAQVIEFVIARNKKRRGVQGGWYKGHPRLELVEWGKKRLAERLKLAGEGELPPPPMGQIEEYIAALNEAPEPQRRDGLIYMAKYLEEMERVITLLVKPTES